MMQTSKKALPQRRRGAEKDRKGSGESKNEMAFLGGVLRFSLRLCASAVNGSVKAGLPA